MGIIILILIIKLMKIDFSRYFPIGIDGKTPLLPNSLSKLSCQPLYIFTI